MAGWRLCPACRVERADWEHDAGGYLPSCPNCGSAAVPADPGVLVDLLGWLKYRWNRARGQTG